MATHHDLLAKIDTAIDKRKRIYGTIGTRSPEVPRVLTDWHNTGISFLLALRAVVELHCRDILTGGNHCRECYSEYPCPTIQAIEKELG